ncbi:polysaccharide biosynthesis tyrosine autokinase [Pseudomonas sp. dw_358]|uniref:polysaccharide biosynthesis tyrosine autokinase n=1 Tax=Pseudomonas sp. dw_358 TaxID=2720083 RepID=UPI001BD3A679|nr:polysaccharide biosynthesis tyrosine autokinase [Pseudomonas sp. dw_358]
MKVPSLTQILHGVRLVLRHKFLIVVSTGVCAGLGWGYTQLAQPVYQATALIQMSTGSQASLDSAVSAQMALMKSQDAISKLVAGDNLEITHTVAHLTLLGNFFARHFKPTPAEPVAAPLLGMATYGWGGETLDVQTLEVPVGLLGETLTLVAGEDGHYTLFAPQKVLLLSGQVGQPVQANGVTVQINQLVARPGTLLYMQRNRVADSAQEFIDRLTLVRGPRGSGLIYLKLQDTRPDIATRMLDAISRLNAGGAKVIDSANTDLDAPASPRVDWIVGVCALLGLFAALGLMVVRQVLHESTRGPDSIDGTGLPVLASLPWSPRQKRLGSRGPLLSQVAREDLSMEALRSLRTSLYLSMLAAPNKALLLCSPSSDAGTSFICSNLAVILAQGGQRVLLVDANLRRGRLHEDFNLRPAVGLADILAAQGNRDDLINRTSITGLDFVGRGRATSASAKLLSAASIEGLLEEWEGRYDVIIFDAPPLTSGPDAALLARQVGTVLLVAREGKYSVSDLDAWRQRLAHQGAPVRGAVFNGELHAPVKRTASVAGAYGYEPTL